MDYMSDPSNEYNLPPDLGPELDYWVPDGEPDPDIPWPDNFEVCGVPAYEPFALRDPKRHGRTVMVWAMFSGNDPVRSIEVVCSVLE